MRKEPLLAKRCAKSGKDAKRDKFREIKAMLCSNNIVVVVALLFYVHGKHLRSCRDGQLT